MHLTIDTNDLEDNIIVVNNVTELVESINTKAQELYNLEDYLNKCVYNIIPREHGVLFKDLTKVDTIILRNEKQIDVNIMKRKVNTDYSILIIVLKKVQYNSKFMANFSHEVRTPLNAIMGIISLLTDTKLTEEQANYIDMLKEAGYNLLRIINDILDYSRLEVGKMLLINKIFYLKSCMESSHDVVLYKAAEKNITMDYTIDPDIPDFVIGDCQRLRQILINLFYNSIKFTDFNGKITTRVSLQKSTEPQLQLITLKFRVIDTGIGIADKDRYKLFTSYSQLYNDFTEVSTDGTGLGLAICKELTELMGGNIWLEHSEINKGSTFCFTVKLKATSEKIKNTNMDINILENKNVLLIDDNHINRMSLCDQLMKWGMHPFPCSTPDEALLFLKKNKKYDLIIIDIRMPKENGFTLAKKIKDLTPGTPLIAVSSIGENVNALYFDIFEHFLIKPVKEHKLMVACISVLQPHTEQVQEQQLESSKNNLDKIRILIDEDMYLNQIVLKTLLIKLGYTNITIVNNGYEAINIIQKEEFDVCLIDIKTPVMSGYEVLNKIKELENPPYCVALTALVAKGEQYLEYGFDDFLFKPIELNTVNSMMTKYVNSRM